MHNELLNLQMNPHQIEKIINVIAALVIFIVIPTIILVVAWRYLKKSKADWLDRKHDVKELIETMRKTEFTARDLLEIIIIVAPISYLNKTVNLFPEIILEIGLVSFMLYYRYKQKKVERSDSEKEILESIDHMISGVSDAKFHLEHLSRIITDKQSELSEKNKIAEQLESVINQREEEAKSWQALSEEQKRRVIEAVKSAQSEESIFKKFRFVIVSIGLNIVATAIWALLGAPGKEELMRLMGPIRSSISKLFI